MRPKRSWSLSTVSPAVPEGGRLLRAFVLLGVLCLAGTACATWQAAQLYRDGAAALERGAPERAAVLLERAAERAPHVAEIQSRLGLAYAASGRDAEARAAFRRARALDCGGSGAPEAARVVERRRAEDLR